MTLRRASSRPLPPQTQEEVTRLQQRLAEAQKAGEMVATRLTTEHLQGSSRLQEQNEELRQELESMEVRRWALGRWRGEEGGGGGKGVQREGGFLRPEATT